jgi:hypothetical protein
MGSISVSETQFPLNTGNSIPALGLGTAGELLLSTEITGS